MIKNKLIKVCGMLNSDNIRAVEELNIDMMGFIFYAKSPRNVASKPDYLPSGVKKVGVFVNSELTYIQHIITEFGLDVVQLHGDETSAFCEEVSNMGVEVIKALLIATEADFEATTAYQKSCDYLLFDTKSEQKGGSGKKFDWTILDNYKGSTPFMLSGGIDPDSAEELNNLDHPMLAGYDLNSKFEEHPAYKNVSKLKSFISRLKNS